LVNAHADGVADDARLVPLADPRPVTDGERALLEALVAPLGLSELAQQAAHSEVVSVCSCGCPSVGLRADGPALSTEAIRRLSEVGRDDVVDVSAWGVNDEGRAVLVTLHVVDGLLHELEVWAGWDGGEVRTTLPSAASLR
jgi:hypothetical protein